MKKSIFSFKILKLKYQLLRNEGAAKKSKIDIFHGQT